MSVTQVGNHMTVEEGGNRVDVYLDLPGNKRIVVVDKTGKILYNGDSETVARQVVSSAVPKTSFTDTVVKKSGGQRKVTDVHALIGQLLARTHKERQPEQVKIKFFLDPRPKPQNYGEPTDPLNYECDS